MSQTFITARCQRMLDSSDEEGTMKKRGLEDRRKEGNDGGREEEEEEGEEEALFLQIDVNHRGESRNPQQQ